MAKKTDNRDDGWVRRNLALIISVVSIVGIICITWISINFIFQKIFPELKGPGGDPKEAFMMLQSILGFVFPLIGTWMGTVLAFYFSKENLEAASKNVSEIFNQVASSPLGPGKVDSRNAYIESTKLAEIIYNKDIVSKPDHLVLVFADVYSFIKNNSKGDRLPIFTSENVLRYIVHQSTVDDFFVEFSQGKFPDLNGKQQNELTLSDMLNKSSDKIAEKLKKSSGFASKTNTIAEVHLIMKNNLFCKDVFITENGIGKEPVLGWLTDTKLNNISKS